MAEFPKNKVQGKSTLPFKIRVRQITGLTLVVLLLLGFVRVGYIIVAHGDEYRSQAEANQLYDTVLQPIRGTIYDCNKNAMVTSASAYILCTAPKSIFTFFDSKVTDRDAVLKQFTKEIGVKIANTLGMSKKQVVRMLRDSEKTYQRIKKKVDAAQRLKLDELLAEPYVYGKNAKGKDLTVRPRVFFTYESDSLRLYPDNNFVSTVIGVTDSDGNGVTGVEKYYNDVLAGKPGRIVTARNANGQSLDSSYETIFNAESGKGVVLTLDQNIQHYLENALTTALDTTKAKGVYGIVMDVHTGAVKAMSDKPDFDLNDPRKLLDAKAEEELKEYEGTDEYNQKLSEKLFDQWNSFCVTSTYEPGSTFKIFTAAAALEEGKVDLNTTYTCNGAYQVARDTVIHCANTSGHGYQTLTQGLMNSCNPFFIHIGQMLGRDTFNKYFEAFGFTERTGIDLTGEAYPIYHPFDKMSIVDDKGNVVHKTEPTVKRQVISEGTAATVRRMMEAVVEGGTGKNAYIEGYRVAGKTATSEKLDAKGGAKQLRYIASFLCFAPANDPQVAILVGVDEPPGNYRGGGVLAAPIAKEVMEATLKYMNVEPQYTADELKKVSRTAPSLVGETLAMARSRASEAQLTIRVVGNGDKVLSQVPTAGQSISENGVIVVYTENAGAQKVAVPSFLGMTASSVKQTALSLGLNVSFTGPSGSAGATAVKQSIPEGTEILAGTTVTVQFQATANMDD
ncbi:MAG: PASTA domain-containing protein [Clostridia bacterium]|nr:PASTA domain-containing protein [Clostridia bacterium]